MNSGVCELPSPTNGRQRVGEEAGLRQPRESPVDGNAHVCTVLPSTFSGLQALGDDRHGLDVAAVGADPHHVAVLRCRSPCASASPISTNCSGCMIAFRRDVLGPVVEVLGEAVGRRHVRELLDLAEGLAVVLEYPRRRVAEGLRLLRAQRVRRASGVSNGS